MALLDTWTYASRWYSLSAPATSFIDWHLYFSFLFSEQAGNRPRQHQGSHLAHFRLCYLPSFMCTQWPGGQSERKESDLRLAVYKTGALPTELRSGIRKAPDFRQMLHLYSLKIIPTIFLIILDNQFLITTWVSFRCKVVLPFYFNQMISCIQFPNLRAVIVR